MTDFNIIPPPADDGTLRGFLCGGYRLLATAKKLIKNGDEVLHTAVIEFTRVAAGADAYT